MKTPETLKRLGIDESGMRAVPRVHLAFVGDRRYRRQRGQCDLCGLTVVNSKMSRHRDGRLCRERRHNPDLVDRRVHANPRKQAYLALMFSMIVNGALPQEGQKSKQHRLLTQEEIARSCGLARRETVTEWLRYYYKHMERTLGAESMPVITRTRRCGQINLYDTATGRCAAEYVVVKAANGQRVYGSKNKARAEQECLERNSKEKSTSKYQVVTREYPSNRYYSPTVAQLAADPVSGKMWDAAADGVEGYKSIPVWTWTKDERMPLSLGARLVATYYFLMGILDPGDKGQPRAILEVHQAKVAAATGLSVSGVYYANLELEKLGIFRIFSDPKKQDGAWIRGPQKVLYLPIRQLTQEEANQERQRLVNCLHRVRDAVAVARAQSLHEELLRAWTGREHRIRAFWNALRRILLGDGMEPSVINALIPRPPS